MATPRPKSPLFLDAFTRGEPSRFILLDEPYGPIEVETEILEISITEEFIVL